MPHARKETAPPQVAQWKATAKNLNVESKNFNVEQLKAKTRKNLNIENNSARIETARKVTGVAPPGNVAIFTRPRSALRYAIGDKKVPASSWYYSYDDKTRADREAAN